MMYDVDSMMIESMSFIFIYFLLPVFLLPLFYARNNAPCKLARVVTYTGTVGSVMAARPLRRRDCAVARSAMPATAAAAAPNIQPR